MDYRCLMLGTDNYSWISVNIKHMPSILTCVTCYTPKLETPSIDVKRLLHHIGDYTCLCGISVIETFLQKQEHNRTSPFTFTFLFHFQARDPSVHAAILAHLNQKYGSGSGQDNAQQVNKQVSQEGITPEHPFTIC